MASRTARPGPLIRADRIHASFAPPGGTRAAPPPAGPPPNGPRSGAPPGQRPDGLLLVDGSVALAGRFETLRRAHPTAEVVDLSGCTITPGLVDAHVHLVEWALARRGVDLSDAGSPEEAAARVAAHRVGRAPGRTAGRTAGLTAGYSSGPAAAAGHGDDWIQGHGWNPHRWHGMPTHHALDRALPGRAVVLRSHDMHAVWVSEEGLRRARIDAHTPDPPGGAILRDQHGEPTGVLVENATALVLRLLPAPAPAERRSAVLDATDALHALGITGVHAVDPDSLELLRAMRADGEPRLRILQHLPLAGLEDAIAEGLRSGSGDAWLRIGGVKMFLDGALGSRTAWMREPYEGSDGRGIATLPEDEFRHAVRRAARAGLASTVHAIGDAAVDLALDVLSDPAARVAALPHRIEHLQLCPPDRIRDPAIGGIVCSVQPSHLITDWAPADRHWGRRARWAYPFGSLLEAGAILAFGSDVPVEPPDPRLGLFAAVARTDLGGRPAGGWHPDERIPTTVALHAFTAGPAAAAGLPPPAGTLEPGAPGDFVAWDQDPLEAPPRELLGLEVRATWVGGAPVRQP